MNKAFQRLFIAFFFPLLATTSILYAESPGQGDLEVVVHGVPSNQGAVRIALYNSADLYKQSGTGAAGALRKVALKINNNSVHYVFKKLPYGIYGAKVFHDTDNSGKLKTTLFGVPTEAYGFSNNPDASRGMPTFQSIQFTVNKQKNKEVITLKSAK